VIRAECDWITKRLEDVEDQSILDLGGGTHHHRFRIPPYIAYELYRPLLLQRNRLAVLEQRLIQRKKDIVFSLPVELLSRVVSWVTPLKRWIASRIPLACTILGDSQNIPLSEESYDGVFALSLLEHVTDPARVLSEARRILKKGGFAFVSIPEIYPYHPSPIDTGLRLKPDELVSFVSPHFAVLDHGSLAEEPSCRVSIVYCRKQ